MNTAYAVPFDDAPVPGTIEKISDLITRVVAEYTVSTGRLPNVGEVEEKAGLSPIEWLKMLATGEKTIPGVARLAANRAWWNKAGINAIFNLDHEFEHVLDPDLADILEAQRDK